ncbi:MAG: dihydroorotase [Prevotella sp.]
MTTLVKNAVVVNEGMSQKADILIQDDTIEEIRNCLIGEEQLDASAAANVVDAEGCFLLPGIIDDHVHFRQPGLTGKADMASESRAAAAGGVTTVFDMPNTVPQTTTLKALDEKFALAAELSVVNHSFFFGATNDNYDLFQKLDKHRIPGIKLFMGSSTGNMLVNSQQSLDKIFSTAPLPIMTHCEDTAIINANMNMAKRLYGDDPAVVHHPEIRSREACMQCTTLAVSLAHRHKAHLHVAHLSTLEELDLFEANDDTVTAEAVIGHLMFTDEDYERLGTRIKVNPSIKGRKDRDALRQALADGRISVVGTDHAPHLLADKQGGCANAASGMPIIQYSLPSMLSLVDEGVLTIERLVELMCHNPARIFSVRDRGFIRKGYKADLVLVCPQSPWTVEREGIFSKCGWSPFEGHRFNWRVERTICNGKTVFADGKIVDTSAAKAVEFR